MNFKELSQEDAKKFATWMMTPLSSAGEIKDWAMFFLGLDIPLEITDPESTSSPLDAIWQVYNTFKNNSGDVNPGYILMSAREGMKTVSVAILEVLLLLHFELEIAHAAATEAQSSVCIQYLENFFQKIDPLIRIMGWEDLTKNKRTVQFKTPSGKNPFLKIVICTSKGMNSLHANVLFLDELDLADPAALKEGANIVGYSKGIYGVKVYLSTRKYAFGNMATAIETAHEKNYKILRWNILDVTERCPPERHRPDELKESRYVGKTFPLRQISVDEFNALPDIEKLKWDFVEYAYAGCKTCHLLPVCRKRLADRPASATGGFYKPIISVIQKFKENDSDIAEAQLMCWKPGSEGLVYPRFNSSLDIGNVISYKKAYETLVGPTTMTNISEITLLHEMQKAGITFYAGVDWGYDHDFVICIVAVIPNGEIWLMETYASPGLEFVDQLEIAKSFRDKYGPQKWFADTAMPSSLKSFTKNGMRCAKFDKDVLGGIEAIRSKISNAIGHRYFKVLYTESNKKAITAITKHRFKLDGQGNVTLTPDDERGVADICDTLRYIGQNICPVRGTFKMTSAWMDNNGVIVDANTPEAKERARVASEHENQMKQQIIDRLGGEPITLTSKKKGGFYFST